MSQQDLKNAIIEAIIVLLYCTMGFFFFVGFNILYFISEGEFTTRAVLVSVWLIPFWVFIVNYISREINKKWGSK